MQRCCWLWPRVVAVMALIALAALTLSGCSPGGDYPTVFPSIHDMPPPRADTPMDANQVQQATEDLITDRDRLSAEAQGSGTSGGAAPKPGPKKPVARGGAAGGTAAVAGDGVQTAGAENK